MKISDLEKMKNEGTESLLSKERRKFLKLGFAVTGVYMGGKVLSMVSAIDAHASRKHGIYDCCEMVYDPHWTMVIRERFCIDCERCKEACIATNEVPSYGSRTEILEIGADLKHGLHDATFMPVLCNHCNRPPCVRVCPTTATWKDETNGIVLMNNDRCIGCKTCMTACPYNARYFKEEIRSIDKCDFCWEKRLSKGETTTACSEACPADVRVFGNLADTNGRVFNLLHTPDSVVWALRPETGAMPNVFYTNV